MSCTGLLACMWRMRVGCVDGAAGARRPGDDGFGAQQELRFTGSTAESGRVDGWIRLDAGAALCDGLCDEGPSDNVSGGARGGGGGGDQHGLLGGALGRWVVDRAWASLSEGRHNGYGDVRRRDTAHAAVPHTAREPRALRGVRGGRLRAAGDLL